MGGCFWLLGHSPLLFEGLSAFIRGFIMSCTKQRAHGRLGLGATESWAEMAVVVGQAGGGFVGVQAVQQ
jgi:hypothetical protein